MASITLSQNVLVLALDTTTRAGSIALVDQDGVRSQTIGDPAVTHGARLPIDIGRTLDAAGVPLSSVDLLAVAAGPGSFTGLRVGISAMQGLAMATGNRIVPVSALDALARGGENPSRPVAAWMDAQRGEVFAALYDPAGARVIIDASSQTPERTVERWLAEGVGGPLQCIGDGAVRYEHVLRDAFGAGAAIAEPPPLAALIGAIALSFPDRAVAPHAVVPIYIRKPDAELARMRRGE